MIAEAGGPELYEKIKAEYYAASKDPFVKDVIHAISESDFTDIIEHVTRPNMTGTNVCTWKECLAYIIAYESDQAVLRQVAKELGD